MESRVTSSSGRRAAAIVLGRSDQAEGWTSWSEDFIIPPLPPFLIIDSLHDDATQMLVGFWVSFAS